MFLNLNPAEFNGNNNKSRTEKFKKLVSYLLNYYPDKHTVLIYSASFYPGGSFTCHKSSLSKISINQLKNESMLIIPPFN